MGLALSLLFCLTLLVLPVKVEAKAKVVAIEGMRYNVDSSLADNLKLLIGKSGKEELTSIR